MSGTERAIAMGIKLTERLLASILSDEGLLQEIRRCALAGHTAAEIAQEVLPQEYDRSPSVARNAVLDSLDTALTEDERAMYREYWTVEGASRGHAAMSRNTYDEILARSQAGRDAAAASSTREERIRSGRAAAESRGETLWGDQEIKDLRNILQRDDIYYAESHNHHGKIDYEYVALLLWELTGTQRTVNSIKNTIRRKLQ